MKRLLLILLCLLGATGVRAQQHTIEYWFDQHYEARGTVGSDSASWQMLLDVSSLDGGLHTLYLHLRDTAGRSSAPRSFIFYKSYTIDSTGFDLGYTCWFDQDYAHRQTGTLGTGNLLLEVGDLRDGLHTLNLQLGSGANAELRSYVFYKVPVFQSAEFTLDYTCWFDQDYAHRQTGTLGTGNLLLEVGDLRDGLHTLNFQLGSGANAELRSYIFSKFGTTDAYSDTSVLRYYYAIDGVQREPIEVSPQGGHIQMLLDVADLPTGFHTLGGYLMTDNGTSSTLHSAMFYKAPAGGSGLTRYEYWLNGDWEGRTTVDIPAQDTLQLVSLMPVDSLPIRSMCFEFAPNGGNPVIYAKNDITFRFWNAEQRFTEATRQYVDERVVQAVVADTLERDTTKVIAAPTGNAIHWFKLAAGTGDSLSFKTDRRCTMQLYAPSGAMVFHASGDSVLRWDGCHAWENGDYYLAIHNAEGTGNVSVSYQWIYKYAVLAWDVHRVGNGGISTITFEGNGFDSLDTLFLVKGNDTIPTLYIDRQSNVKVGVIFDFEGADTGVYNAMFVYVDENFPVNNVIGVESYIPSVLNSYVSYPSTFLRGSTVTYTLEITNTGNMTAYNVPLYAYIGTSSINNISHLKFDGLNLPSIIAGIDLYSLAADEIKELQEWAEEEGDDHYFYKLRAFDSISGDSVWVRSNYFFLTLAPYETRTLTLDLTATGSVDVWFTIPDTIPPLQYPAIDTVSFPLPLMMKSSGLGNYVREWYCCVNDNVQCALSEITTVLDFVGIITNALSIGAPETAAPVIADLAVNLAACISGSLSNINQVMSFTFCHNEQNDGHWMWKALNYANNTNSLSGTVSTCLSRFNIAGKISKICSLTCSGIEQALQGVTHFNCASSFSEKKPDCPPKPPKGGKSTSYVPVDPNEITGYIAESGSMAVGANQVRMPYMIEFENDSTLATGMAHTVIVRDTLDGSVFDLNSFSATSFTIGEEVVTVDGGQSFIQTVDMRPEMDVLAQVRLDYRIDTGFAVATWTFTSLDPMTLQPSTADTLGFLGIGGTGEVNFTINRKMPLPDSTIIANRAVIVFDNEEPIATSTWVNIVDNIAPASVVDTVFRVDDTTMVSISASDNLSGVWRYNVYAQVGNEVLLPVALNVPYDSAATFVPPTGVVKFHTAAVDSAGNVEQVSLKPSTVFDTVHATACDSFVWHDSIYTASGEYTFSIITSLLTVADSITTLYLTINPSAIGDTTTTACDSFVWHGTTYTNSDTATYTTANAAGCDSTVTLHLTVNHSNTGDTTATACDSFAWHSTTYTTDCTTTYTTANAAGCDSTVTLHLTVNLSSSTTIIDSAVGNYVWNGTTYTESGTYEWSGMTEEGCDSTVTLILAITPLGIDIVGENPLEVNVYPNPTTGCLNIDADGISSIEVYDLKGRKVAEFVAMSRIDISGLPKGVYIIRTNCLQGVATHRVTVK